MKRAITLVALAGASLALSGCMGTGYGVGLGYSSGYGGGYYPSGYGYGAYPYDGWYDGYYGPIYDGYWGNDGYFYYRSSRDQRDYRRGDNHHFRRQHEGRERGYHEMRGTLRYDRDARMPSFPDRTRSRDDRTQYRQDLGDRNQYRQDRSNREHYRNDRSTREQYRRDSNGRARDGDRHDNRRDPDRNNRRHRDRD
ncbi:hypothetical protein RXV95_03870 [Novosphingobium sp. ZN18A2]|uniref:hypothetical protein n=1 Tax=Novosphingobium sp. ZN18A2 TaxID=3079861 RepID=UPI0030D35F24